MRAIMTLSLALLFAALFAAPSSAQQSATASDMLSTGSLEAAVLGHETVVSQQRAELAHLLSREEVRDIAQDRGIDMGRVETAAAGLSDAQVTAVAPLVAAAAAPVQDNGGLGSVTISVAVLIIALLILILVT